MEKERLEKMIVSSINYMADGSVRAQVGKEWYSFDTVEEFDKWKQENFETKIIDKNQLTLPIE